MIEGESLALDALEHDVSRQSVCHFALRRVAPYLSTVNVVLHVGSKGFDSILLHHLFTDSLHELEAVAIDVECKATLQHVPFLLDLCPHARVAGKL